ncbi:MAG: CPBP family intramembrane metalloprotease [Cyanobacteria bacterium J007]|nr:MAG: CPBP family intramembrane metalloprotease [Cyanobacteria bacterium J007]
MQELDINGVEILAMLLFNVLKDRLVYGLTTLPNLQDWLFCFALLGLYAVIALPIGFYFDFIQVDIRRSRKAIALVMASCLLTPGISEEVCFRLLLLPHPSENASFTTVSISAIASLIAFVIYHPLNGWTLARDRCHTFTDPVFLSLASLLGLCCTIAYLKTGSIWSSVFLHWAIVVVWLLLLGGIRELGESEF